MKRMSFILGILGCLFLSNYASAQSVIYGRPGRSIHYIDGKLADSTTLANPGEKTAMMPTYTGKSYSSQDLMRMPTRDVNKIANMTPGVTSYGGQTPSIRGARPDGTAYFVDGIRVYGGLPVIR